MAARRLIGVELFRIIVMLIVGHFCGATTDAAAAAEEYTQLNGTFQARTIKSGPVFLLDKRTIFISMFRYSHHGINNVQKKSRWLKALAGDGTSSTRLVDLHFLPAHGNATRTPAELTKDYESENVYLRLADDTDFGSFDAVVIVNHEDRVEARVDIGSSGEIRLDDGNDQGNPWIDNGTFVFRYPKCCPNGQHPDGEFCTQINKDISASPRVPVHENDEDRFNPEAADDLIRKPFFYRPECDEMYILDEKEEVYMLMNAHLISALPQFACLDFIEDENGEMKEEIFMCAYNNINAEFSNTIYVGMMYFSSAVLLLWALVLSIMLWKKKLQVKTIVVLSIIYSVFYSLHFITLATAREIGVVSGPCRIAGYVYQFLLLASFTALFALIFEGYYRVKHYREEHSRRRLLIYTCFCAVPIVTTLVSIFTNELTLSTTNQQQRDVACWFRSERKVYSYYVPIIIIILCCLLIQIETWFNIRKYSRRDPAIFGMEVSKFKNMFRLGAYLNGIMTLCWTMEVLSYYFEVENNFWFIVDAFNAMQGFIIFCAFSYHYFHVWQKLLACAQRSHLHHLRSAENVQEMMPIKA